MVSTVIMHPYNEVEGETVSVPVTGAFEAVCCDIADQAYVDDVDMQIIDTDPGACLDLVVGSTR